MRANDLEWLSSISNRAGRERSSTRDVRNKGVEGHVSNTLYDGKPPGWTAIDLPPQNQCKFGGRRRRQEVDVNQLSPQFYWPVPRPDIFCGQIVLANSTFLIRHLPYYVLFIDINSLARSCTRATLRIVKPACAQSHNEEASRLRSLRPPAAKPLQYFRRSQGSLGSPILRFLLLEVSIAPKPRRICVSEIILIRLWKAKEVNLRYASAVPVN